MNLKFTLQLVFVLLSENALIGQILRTWDIDSFQVNLIRYEQVQETPGIFPIDRPSAKA